MPNYSCPSFSRNVKFVGEIHKRPRERVAEGGVCLMVCLAGVAERSSRSCVWWVLLRILKNTVPCCGCSSVLRLPEYRGAPEPAFEGMFLG